MDIQSPQELQANLDEYRGQLQQVGFSRWRVVMRSDELTQRRRAVNVQVDELLTLDPGNSEYQDLHTSLSEVGVEQLQITLKVSRKIPANSEVTPIKILDRSFNSLRTSSKMLSNNRQRNSLITSLDVQISLSCYI